MVQGVKKITNSVFKKDKSKNQLRQQLKDNKKAKKGSARQLPKNSFRSDALDDRDLSKAIDKANEQKVAQKCIQVLDSI